MLTVAVLLSLRTAPVFHQAPGLKQAIAFISPAKPAYKVLESLSAQTGVELHVNAPLKSDILAVRVKHASLKDLLAQIAKVTNGEWKPEGSGLRLTRPSNVSAELRRQDVKSRIRETQELLDAGIPLSHPKPNSNQTAPEVVLDLLRKAGATSLVDDEPLSRFVFATHPNNLQRQLPNEPQPDSAQTLLVCTRTPDSLNSSLEPSHRDGMIFASGQLRLRKPPIIPSEHATDTPVRLSDAAQEFLTKWNGRSANNHAAPASSIAITMSTEDIRFSGSSDDSVQAHFGCSEALVKVLTNPENTDPAELVPGAAFENAADVLGANLVADIPDTAFSPLATCFTAGEVSPEELLSRIAPLAGLIVDRSRGWITVSPMNPIEAERRKVDRPALGKMLRKLNDKHFLSLDDMAEFCLSQEKPLSMTDIDGIYLMMVGQGTASKLIGMLDNPYPLRIFGTLARQQRRALLAGQPMVLRRLSSDQRSWLEKDVMNRDDGPYRSSLSNPMPADTAKDTSSIQNERTILLSDGIQFDGALVVTAKSTPGYLATDVGSGITAIVTANTLASHLFQRERPDLGMLGTPPQFNRFASATSTIYVFQYQLSPSVAFTRTLVDTSVDPSSRDMAFSDLPQAFQDDVQGQLEAMRKTFTHKVFEPKSPPP